MCSTIAKIGSPSWLRTVSPRMRPRRRISSRSGKSLSGESIRSMITRIQNIRPRRRPRIRRRPSGWAFVLEPRSCTTNSSDAWSGPLATHTTSHYNYRRRIGLQGRRNRVWSSATPNPHQRQRRGGPSRGAPYVTLMAYGGSAAPSWLQNDPRRRFASLSRRKQGFESPRERQSTQALVLSARHLPPNFSNFSPNSIVATRDRLSHAYEEAFVAARLAAGAPPTKTMQNEEDSAAARPALRLYHAGRKPLAAPRPKQGQHKR